MIDVVHGCTKKWCFEANVAECAVAVFRNERNIDAKEWGESTLPHFDYCHWDIHKVDLVIAGKC